MDHSNSTPPADAPALPSTVEYITGDCRRFRILVLGKTGCGKSSLINKVFGIEKVEDHVAQVAHDGPGKADINVGFCPNDNDRFMLHDSEGFEPGEDIKFKTVKKFIEEQSKMPQLKDRLHAIWICISVPVARDRVVETGVEQIVKMERGDVPIIIVFTKYDMLVTTEIRRAVSRGGSTEQVWQDADMKAQKVFEELCVGPLTKAIGKVPITKVSGQPRFSSTIKELIQTTDTEIQRHTDIFSHTEPRSLTFAAAQRGNPDLKVEASIDIGRLKYWSGLLSITDFTGKKLQQCLDVIHRDIISIWNIRNSNYLTGNDFKAKMTVLVDDLVVHPDTPTPSNGLTVATVAAVAGAASSPAGIVILSIGTAVLVAKWLFDVYENSTRNVACVMAYIVDLTIIMRRLSVVEISEERVISILQEYAKSGEIAQVHNDIRKFCNHNRIAGPRRSGNDDTLDEIVRLIEQHRIQAPPT